MPPGGPGPTDCAPVRLELYVRLMQEIRRGKPSTVSRRTSVITGFYRTCLFDEVLQHSPADHLRRPTVPAESPTPGPTHLQFEAMLSTGRLSTNRNDRHPNYILAAYMASGT